ncbi:laccase-15-like isoform X2 [Anneissia japonica]|uniref:laccase-15-like isoform X1 n=1 Tax=Anneissia japonica TaxID=1529436 RepID=UPI001425791A|nr:laccase-15-like isoform X1 [Anneissia japonica]XP_033110384.1 laccase-15-like isoform X2 [Anneissia japonica]
MSDWSTIDGLETFTTAYAPAKVVRDHTINILINGKAQGAEFIDAFGRSAYTPRETFGVVKGNRYRMRIMNAAATSCNIAVYVESHSLKVIAADGSLVDPVDVDYLIISPGESYDFVIYANQEESSYCMHFVGTSSSACQISSSAILHYNDYDKNLACSNSLIFDDVVSSHHSNYYTAPSQEMQTVTLDMLHSFDSVGSSLVGVDDLRYISLSTFYDDRFKSLNTYGGVQVIDNVAYKVSHAPLLSHETDGIEICEANGDYKIYESCEDKICSCTNVMKLELGKVVEFVLMNVKGSVYSHPMHLHGHSFLVMGQGTFDDQSVTEDEVKALDTSGLLQRLPVDQVVIKNTVDVPVNGYAIIRWKADNPGLWYFHSEVVNHHTAGMGVVIQVGDDDEITKPPKDFPKCGPWSP